MEIYVLAVNKIKCMKELLFHQYLAPTQSPGYRQCRTLHFPAVPIQHLKPQKKSLS
jgi:hypothetical protein